MRNPRQSPRRYAVLVALTGSLLALAGCGMAGTNSGGYLTGDGQVQEIAVDQREAPVQLSGKLLDGSPFDPSSIAGKVTVVNFWWSGCGPCNSEMPMLQSVHQKLGDKVAFLGVNIRDTSAATGLAFERGHGVTYPSLYAPGGQATLAFAKDVSPRTIPATAVLDTQGRVAAIIRGAIPSELTLEDVVEDVQGGASAAASAGASGAAS